MPNYKIHLWDDFNGSTKFISGMILKVASGIHLWDDFYNSDLASSECISSMG